MEWAVSNSNLRMADKYIYGYSLLYNSSIIVSFLLYRADTAYRIFGLYVVTLPLV